MKRILSIVLIKTILLLELTSVLAQETQPKTEKLNPSLISQTSIDNSSNPNTVSPSWIDTNVPAPGSNNPTSAQSNNNSTINNPELFKDLKDSEYWSGLCRLLTADKNYNSALYACDRALSLRFKNPQSWADRANLLFLMKRYGEAVASADMAIKMRKDFSQALAIRCAALVESDKYNEAVDSCETALIADSRWGTLNPAFVWHTRGVALSRQRNWQLAIASFDRALRLQSDYSEALTNKCAALTQVGNYGEAIASCEEAIAVNKNWNNMNPGLAWNLRSQAQIALGSKEQAISTLDQSINTNPQDPVAWSQQGVLLASNQKFTEASLSFKQATRLNPNYTYALVNQCAVANQLKQYQEAIKACTQALTGDGTWTKLGPSLAWNELSIALTRTGQYDEALAAANRAIGSNAGYAKAWNDRGVILWYLEKYEEALKSIDRSLALESKNQSALLNKGRILRSLSKYQESVAVYDQAITLDSKNAETWSNRSVSLWHLGNYEEALSSAQQATTLNPKLSLAWYNLGVALLSLNRPLEALDAYRTALNLNPDSADIWTAIGIALIKDNQTNEAIFAFGQALKINPNQTVAAQQLKAIPRDPLFQPSEP